MSSKKETIEEIEILKEITIIEEITKHINKVKKNPKEEVLEEIAQTNNPKDKGKIEEVIEMSKPQVGGDAQTSNYSKQIISDYLNEKTIDSTKGSYDQEEAKKQLVESHITELVTFQDTQKMVRFGKMNQFFGAKEDSTRFAYIAESERERYKWWAMFNRVQSFMVYDLTTI